MSEPKRVQRKRVKGWRMPDKSKYLGRPTKFGNRFPPDTLFGDVPQDLLMAVNIYPPYHESREIGLEVSLRVYRVWLQRQLTSGAITWEEFEQLKEYDYLTCWCPLDQDCHVDIIIEFLGILRERISSDGRIYRCSMDRFDT